MSVLNVWSTTELDGDYTNRRYRSIETPHHHHQQDFSNLVYRRLHHHHNYHQSATSYSDSLSHDSSYTSSTSSFEVIFSRLLDALIFTSAIAITAYSYLTGSLVVTGEKLPKVVGYHPTQHELKRHSSHNSLLLMDNKHQEVIDSIEDSKRKRTQEWAEQQIIVPIATPAGSCFNNIHHHHHHSSLLPQQQKKKRACSAAAVSLDGPSSKKVQQSQSTTKEAMKREKKRTLSLPVNNLVEEKEDELLTRIELLRQQCQDALESPIA